ncbi:MFS alpha-glucoside transporter [Colletotrichum truncatum]|uniref:MFS alpha-glucoside transporter n=1 Tax=Colletotrichum truncatum TaxID=5467 RepID=A0ACC3YIQ4_COLTU|nr:MFS alpha-glucoside transporter [Colletotrichum truncatum]KAF6786133.1 MFS alpha-glucoside transporter [Colletotrichum truncatum]
MALDEKTATEVVGHQDVLGTSMTKNLSSEAAATGQGVSGYEDLSLWATVKKFKFNSFICFIVALSAATDGYQIGMVGNIIANAGFVEQFGTEINSQGQKYLASPVLSGFNGIGSAGQIIGMVTLPFLSGRWGRKFAMYWLWFLLALSVALECIAKNWQVWLVAKLFGGIGVGCLQTTIPTYISEVAPTRIRGSLLMCYSLWWLIGQFFAPVALQSQIGLMIIIYLFVPESPAWCVSQGKEERARKALRQLHWDVNGYDLDHQYNLLVLIVEHEKEVAAEQRREKWYSIFRGQDGLRTVIAMWTLLSQQFIGLGIFFAYVTYFFQQTGIQDPFKITCIVSGINIFFSVIVIYLADVVGRRLLACGGTTICWVCTVVVGILGVTPETNASQYVLVLFTVIWNVGLVANGATGWGFIGEISSQRLRHYTAGFAAASTCVVGVVLGVLIPYMINANDWNWGLKTSWFFVGLGLPFTAAMWFLIPETKGRSAAELDELFERKIRPWRFHKTATVTQRMVETSKEANQMVV